MGHVGGDLGGSFLVGAGPASQGTVDDGKDHGQAGGVDGVDEIRLWSVGGVRGERGEERGEREGGEERREERRESEGMSRGRK